MAAADIKNIKKKNLLIIISSIILGIFVVIVFVDFFIASTTKLERIAAKELSNLGKNQVSDLEKRVDSIFTGLEEKAVILSLFDDLNSKEVEDTLAKLSNGYDGIYFLTTNEKGMGYIADGELFNLSLHKGFDEAIRGKRYMSPVEQADGYDERGISFWIPVKKNNKIIGTLRAFASMQGLEKYVGNALNDNDTKAFVVTSTGEYILSNYNGTFSENQKYVKDLCKALGIGEVSGPLLAGNEHDQFEFDYNDTKEHMVYYKVGADSDFDFQNTYVFITLSSELYDSMSRVTKYTGALAATKITCILIIMAVIFINAYSYKLDQAFDVLNEYANESSKRNELLTQTGMIMYNWDLLNDELTISDAWKDYFSFNRPKTLSELKELNAFYPEDFLKTKAFIERVLNETETGEVSIRLCTDLTNVNSFKWFKLLSIVENDREGKPKAISGFLISIDFEKEETMKVKKTAEIDPLTKIFNRNAAYTRIVDYLQGEGKGIKHMFMVLDVDNFKYVNDEYGHLEGDECLIEVANKLKKLFKINDIVGRFGGDEFIIMMKDCTDIDPSVKVKEIMDAMTIEGEEGRDKITVSVGHAVYPSEGRSYERLFQKADERMYAVKKPKFKKISSKATQEPNVYDDSI